MDSVLKWQQPNLMAAKLWDIKNIYLAISPHGINVNENTECLIHLVNHLPQWLVSRKVSSQGIECEY